MADKTLEKPEPDKLFIYNWDKSRIATEGYIRINITENNVYSYESNGIKVIIAKDVIDLIYSFYFGINIKINTRYYKDTTTTFYDQTITVPINSSLQNIWKCIQKNFNQTDNKQIANIILPIFTLRDRDAYKDIADIAYFSNDKNQNDNDVSYMGYSHYYRHRERNNAYNPELFDKNYYAKILYHKLNPLKVWNNNDNAYHMLLNGDDTILCFEESINLSTPIHQTVATQHYKEEKNFSFINVTDYTQIDDDTERKSSNNDLDYDIIGSSRNPNAKQRQFKWKIPKGTSLQKFFEIARDKCNVPNDVEIRVLRVLDNDRFLITFPYKFQLSSHEVVLERGRYPKYTEVYLMTTIINEDNSTLEYIPYIIDKSRSVKILKKTILSLFKLNPNDYKKYLCYNINHGTDQKRHPWRDALTLNSNKINPIHCDRVGLQVGEDKINKKVNLIKDTRDLTKLWENGHTENNSNILSGAGLNPYIQSELGTISIDGNATLQELRRQIYSIQQIKNDVNSYKNIYLSWLDPIYQIPHSFPKLTDGKLAGQKLFDSQRSVICVEILNEEIDNIPKHSRFLHFHLAKIKTLSSNDEDKKENDDKTIWEKNNCKISFWPPDHHLRTSYFENGNDTEDRVSYAELTKFFCKKYNILPQNLLITMFYIKPNKSEWMLIDDSCDQNEKGLVGKPFGIRKTNHHNQIFAIFDLSQCVIKDFGDSEKKLEFIKNSMKYWPIPPLSAKSKFHYEHFNQGSNRNKS